MGGADRLLYSSRAYPRHFIWVELGVWRLMQMLALLASAGAITAAPKQPHILFILAGLPPNPSPNLIGPPGTA